MENACCNDGLANTNKYFAEKESSIRTHNDIIKRLVGVYDYFKQINKGPFFNLTLNTKLVYPAISTEFSKETIYLAFIKFCKFNTGIELNGDLKRICALKMNAVIDKQTQLADKILAMEADGLNYSKETLNALLNFVNRENILDYDLDPPVTTEKLELEKTIQYLKE